MKVKNYGSNQTLIEEGNCQVLYSYETPVALIVRDGKVRAYRTDEFHSVTTSKHINQFLRKEGVYSEEIKEIPQEVLSDWKHSEFSHEL